VSACELNFVCFLKEMKSSHFQQIIFKTIKNILDLLISDIFSLRLDPLLGSHSAGFPALKFIIFAV
jgi:hypothetical protein